MKSRSCFWKFSRAVNGDATMATIKCPILITQGAADEIVLLSMSESIKEQISHATLSIYEGVGHTTYGELPDRFNAELADFVREATA